MNEINVPIILNLIGRENYDWIKVSYLINTWFFIQFLSNSALFVGKIHFPLSLLFSHNEQPKGCVVNC